MWRTLTPEEEGEFRQSARDNYEPLTPINGVWHPVYQYECVKMNQERCAEINRLLAEGE